MLGKTFIAISLLTLVFSPGLAATVFHGSGTNELLPGDSVVLENNSSIVAGNVMVDYAYLDFFGPYGVHKFGLDLYPADFGKARRVDAVGLKFSATPVYKAAGAYALLLNASVLRANLALVAELRQRSGAAVGSVSPAGLVSRLTVKNTGDLTLEGISMLFALSRNGEDIFSSENKSAIARLAPGQSADVPVPGVSWPLIPLNPSRPDDNFSVRIVLARNQFEETDYSDNEIDIPVSYAAPTPTPTATPLATATPVPTATATPAPSASATAGPATQGAPADNTILYAGIALVAVVLAAAAFLLTRRPPANASKPKKG